MALLLCDMDKTLVSGIASYKSAMEQAIYRVFGMQVEADLSKFHGSTDRFIIQDVLTKHLVHYDNPSLEKCLQTFGEVYPENPADLEVMPGVLETIPGLSERNLLGLVTGNVEAMARKKLKKFSLDSRTLNDYFPFGGFGSDPHEKRADLVTLAIERARRYGWKGTDNGIYVIDDTPKGVKAALEAGVIPIGITTGIYTREQLEEAGAKIVVGNFTEIPILVAKPL